MLTNDHVDFKTTCSIQVAVTKVDVHNRPSESRLPDDPPLIALAAVDGRFKFKALTVSCFTKTTWFKDTWL